MKRLLLLLFLAMMPAAAEWNLSVGILAGASAFDAASSIGRYELNPVLGRGPFGRRQIAIKGSLFAVNLALQREILRRNPSARRKLAITNFIVAGALGTVAATNLRK